MHQPGWRSAGHNSGDAERRGRYGAGRARGVARGPRSEAHEVGAGVRAQVQDLTPRQLRKVLNGVARSQLPYSKKTKQEQIKDASHQLRGTIAKGLDEVSTGAIADDDQYLVRFHGTYLQDDRDVRGERLLDGVSVAGQGGDGRR